MHHPETIAGDHGQPVAKRIQNGRKDNEGYDGLGHPDRERATP